MRFRLWVLVVTLLMCMRGAAVADVEAADVAAVVAQLRAAAPKQLDDYQPQQVPQLRETARRLEQATASLCKQYVVARPDLVFVGTESVSNARQAADQLLNQLLEHRTLFARIANAQARVEKVQQYLQSMTILIDLCGRLNRHYAGMVRDAAFLADRFPDGFIRLAQVVREDESGISTSVLAWMLTESAEAEPEQYREVLLSFQRVLLVQLLMKGRPDALPVLAEFLTQTPAHPQWKLVAGEAIQRIGLPQDPPPHVRTTEEELPPITAGTMLAALRELRPTLPQQLLPRCDKLIDWAQARHNAGIDSSLSIGDAEVRRGDWVLMRNSSPYNNCTNLAPGLFTHVGVAAMHRGEDGRGRLVVVDVTERKRIIDGDNLDKDLRSAIHYAILRHEDPQVADKMGQVAASLIGNPMEFDLTFDTSKVLELKGQELAGRKIETYCAGLLLLCAQETGRPRSEFFPIPESPIGGNGKLNFKTMGVQFGDDFISPTGTLFAERMKIVTFGEPMFDPGRAVEQRIFDYFAKGLEEKILSPKANVFQQLRLQAAQLARSQPLVREALAAAANVNPETDLVSAAKAAAVIETLDEIAFAASEAFAEAMSALSSGPDEQLQESGMSTDEIRKILTLRQQHSQLWNRIVAGEMSPREATDELIEYYSSEGRRQMDRRIFTDAPEEATRSSETAATP